MSDFRLLIYRTYFAGISKLADGTHAFFVRKTRSLPAVSVDTNIVYENVVLNHGGYYNQNVGRYSAPERGIYFFIMNALTLRVYTRVLMMHNGREVSRSYAAAFLVNGNPRNQNACMVGILMLQARDEVHTVLGARHDLNGEGWSHFGGFMLAAV